MDSRSFHYHGTRFPVCARCTGELAGILVAAILYGFVHPGPLWAALALIPMVLDGGVQALTAYESTNPRRFVTGTLFGYGLATLLFLSTAGTFRWGMAMGARLAAAIA